MGDGVALLRLWKERVRIGENGVDLLRFSKRTLKSSASG
jgi:hypothetical protein